MRRLTALILVLGVTLWLLPGSGIAAKAPSDSGHVGPARTTPPASRVIQWNPALSAPAGLNKCECIEARIHCDEILIECDESGCHRVRDCWVGCTRYQCSV